MFTQYSRVIYSLFQPKIASSADPKNCLTVPLVTKDRASASSTDKETNFNNITEAPDVAINVSTPARRANVRGTTLFDQSVIEMFRAWFRIFFA